MNLSSIFKAVSRSTIFLFGIVFSAGSAAAQQLGGGESPDISIWRILLALFFCLLIALAAIWFLHRRNMRGPVTGASKPWLAHFSLFNIEGAGNEIEIIAMRKLNPHCDACVIQCRGQEYSLLLDSNGVTILDQKAIQPNAAASTEEV